MRGVHGHKLVLCATCAHRGSPEDSKQTRARDDLIRDENRRRMLAWPYRDWP